MTPNEFREIITPIIYRFNGSETSGIRSEKRNTIVGGHPESRHLYGLAVDVVLDDKRRDKEDFLKECRRQGLIVIDEGDHIHVQTR